MSKDIYIVIGVPGSGKTWVCEQLKDKYNYIPHDDPRYMKYRAAYLRAIKDAAMSGSKDVLIEAPFSVSQTREPLESEGFKVKQIYIIEPEHVLHHRYETRDNKPLPKGHLTRMATYHQRAEAEGHYHGTASNVLAHLKSMA